jgi:acyl-coenzyme A synthetase/AMP-(fatty) acid ligase
MTASSQGKSGKLWSLWKKTASANPRARILTDATIGKSYTAADLTRMAESLVRCVQLPATGAVAWQLPNGADWLAIFLATQFASIAALPLDPGLNSAQGRSLAQRLGASHWWDGKQLHPLGPASRRWTDVAVIKISSGTTGRPKALPCRARHLTADYAHIRSGMGLRPKDINLGLIPFGHSYGLGNLVLPLLCDGLPIVTAAVYTITQVRDWIDTYRPTVFPCVPLHFRLLHQSLGSDRLGRLRLLISAGAPLSAEVARAFHSRFGLRLHNFYGSSETGGICYDRTGRASLASGAVGKPLPGVKVSLVRGRVAVTSRAVIGSASRRVLKDRGAWNKQGNLLLTGRVGRMANISGRKVALAEIETALRSLSGVTDAWCSIGHRQNGDFIAAVVETSESNASLRAATAESLPAWKRPRFLLALRAFPRTARGKTDTRALRRVLHVPGLSQD